MYLGQLRAPENRLDEKLTWRVRALKDKGGKWYERGRSGDLEIKMGLHRTYRTLRRDKMEENNLHAEPYNKKRRKI
jgi:hypothetical protein